MGEVFAAQDERLNRRVALKRFHTRLQSPRVRQRFHREARALAALNHPAVVQIYDLLEHEEEPWIVMEFVDGRPLNERLKWGPLEVGEAIRLARDIVSGLAAAHGVGLVHRDLKASNILIGRGGQVKILDFGLATEPLNSDDPGISVEGRLVGTPIAMSPEQTLGQKVDHRSDLFSFGSLLYHALTGKAPFSSGDSLKTMASVRSAHPPSLDQVDPGIPHELARVVEHLLQKDPDERPQSALQVASIFDALIAQGFDVDSDVTRDADQTLVAGRPTSPPVEKGSPLSLSRRSSAPSEERRLITVLTCELVSSEVGSGALDPEEVVELGPRLRRVVAKAVARYDGHLEGFQGHRLTAYFGYPTAHEDDPRRAILAALEVLDSGSSMESSFGSRMLAIRAGLHTGPAVATIDASDHSQLMLGPTIDTAVLLSQGAAAHQAVVSATTKALVESFFELEFAGSVGGHEAWLVGPVVAESTIDTSRIASPMVSRDHELRLIVDRWRMAQDSEGQVLTVSGEPGIGKSRLLAAVRRELEDAVATSREERALQWHEISGSAYHTDSPLRPLRRWLATLLAADARGVDRATSDRVPEETAASKRAPLDRLEALVARLDLDRATSVPYLAALLSLPSDARFAPLEDLAPGADRAATLEALLRLILSLAEAEPMVLVFEDLHWADASSLEVVKRLIESASSAPILVVLTARPEFVAPWPPQPHLTQLAISRLGAADAGALLDQIPGSDRLPPTVREQILEITDGVPLFVEEVTRSVLEDLERGSIDQTGAAAIEVPMTLQGTLTARLDRLGAAKELAQLAAAQGREFSRSLLGATAGLTDTEVRQRLQALVAAGLVRRQRGSRNDHIFKHALVRDAAYDSMVRSQKVRVHERLARALPEQFPGLADEEPEILAFHLQEAGRLEEGLECWRKAARMAMARSAMVEGHSHLTAALGVLDRLPKTRERLLVRADLIKTKGLALGMITTPVAPEVREQHLEAAKISRELGDEPALFSSISALWSWYLFTGQRRPAEECVAELEELADRSEDPEARWLVKALAASLAFYGGQLESSRELFSHGVSRFDELEQRPLAAGTLGLWEEATVAVLGGTVSGLGAAFWYLGFPDRAMRDKDRLLAYCEGRTRLNALNHYADIELLRGDFEQARATAEEAMKLADELAPGLSLQSMVYLGSALVGLETHGLSGEGTAGGLERAYQLIQQGIGGFRMIGVEWHLHRFRTLEVRALVALGRVDEALEVAEQALNDARSKLESYLEAEFLRLRGEILVLRGDSAAARSSFERSVATARQQSSRSLELRSATSLARLLDSEGDRESGRELLEPIYQWFTEGHDTLDLVEARVLLEKLEEELEA